MDEELEGITGPFEANYDGRRTIFVKVEHANIGGGWMCREHGVRRGRIYSSHLMTDIEPIRQDK